MLASPLRSTFVIASCLFVGLVRAEAQESPGPGGWAPIPFEAPGHYGVAWGSASYGIPLTYSGFSSSYGANYGLGYPPSVLLPGRFGQELWRPYPGAATRVLAPYGRGEYRTFRYSRTPDLPSVPLGLYAPYLGPPTIGIDR